MVAVLRHCSARIVTVRIEELRRSLPAERLARCLVLGIRVVRRVERHVHEERAGCVAVDKVDRCVGEDVCGVARELARFGANAHVQPPVVDVRVVVAVTGYAANVLVESPVRGAAALGESDVPLSESSGRVTPIPQEFG